MPGDGENRWYYPEERWPRHPRPWFRDALDYARERGWLFKKLSNHSFGGVYCRHPDDGDHCRFRVDSTGRSGENAARDLRRLIDGCTHCAPGASNSATTIEALVGKAEVLTAAAAALIDESRHTERAMELYARAEELLDEAQDRVDEAQELADEAEQLVSDAMDAEREALAAHRDGASMLARTEVPPDERASAVLDVAEQTADDARSALSRERNSPSVRDLRHRVRAVRNRIGQLREDLKSNPSADESFNAE